jgi:type I restriction enzyme S subunit
LYYWLKSNINYIKQLGTGTTFAEISSSVVKDIDISLPPLPEQQAIAEVLSSLDDKIDLLHRQNKTLEDMAQTLFRQWFIEEAQDDWEEVKIQDFDVLITDYVANGSFASLKENVKLITDKVSYALFVRNTDIKSGFKNKVYVDKSSYDFLKKTKLYGKEIIISNVGDVGSVFRCPNFDIPMTLGNNLIMLKSNYNLFFYLLFSSKYGQNLIAGITSGSVQQKFNKTAFRNLSLKFESIFQLKRFEDKVSILFDKQDANQTQIQTLENLRDTLLPKLISAEVRVRY